MIGWRHEIENISIGDLKDFHRKWFVPNNAVIVVVGDFILSDVKRLVEKYFGDIKPKNVNEDLNCENLQNLAFQKEINYLTFKKSVASAIYAYKVPSYSKKSMRKSIALAVAVQALNGPAFYVKKILKGIANKVTDISFSYVKDEYAYDLILLEMYSDSLDNLYDAEMIWKYMKLKVSTFGITQSDLDLVKKKRSLALAYRNEDISHISYYFGRLLTKGYNVEQIQSIDDLAQALTLKECNDVLKEVFSSNHIAIGRMSQKGYDYD